MVAVCGEYYAFIYSAFNDWLDVICGENKQTNKGFSQTNSFLYVR